LQVRRLGLVVGPQFIELEKRRPVDQTKGLFERDGLGEIDWDAIASAFLRAAKERRLNVSHSENGFIESFNARLRDELMYRETFHSLAEARIVIESWLRQHREAPWIPRLQATSG
jgi:hypothetical protein